MEQCVGLMRAMAGEFGPGNRQLLRRIELVCSLMQSVSPQSSGFSGGGVGGADKENVCVV